MKLLYFLLLLEQLTLIHLLELSEGSFPLADLAFENQIMLGLFILHEVSHLLDLLLAFVVSLLVFLCSAFLSIHFLLELHYFLLQPIQIVILVIGEPETKVASFDTELGDSVPAKQSTWSDDRVACDHVLRGESHHMLLSLVVMVMPA